MSEIILSNLKKNIIINQQTKPTNLDDYIWKNILQYNLIKDNIITEFNISKNLDENEKNEIYKEIRKVYDLNNILDDEKLNNQLFLDHNRTWSFIINMYNGKINIKEQLGNSIKKDNYIEIFEKNLRFLIDNDDLYDNIIKKIKIIAFQSVLTKSLKDLINYFNAVPNFTYNRFMLEVKELNEPTFINIYKKDHEDIISTFNFRFSLYLNDFENNIKYSITIITINYEMNLSKNNILVKYNLEYKDNLAKLYFEIFNKNTFLLLIYNILFRNNNNNIIQLLTFFSSSLLKKSIIYFEKKNNKLDKKIKFYQYIYNLLQDIQINLNTKLLEQKFNFFKDNINYFYNIICENNNLTIPIRKNIKDKVKSDFLICSYNEGNENFNYNDCLNIIYKILNENPSFLFICTQESKSGEKHFQHVLGNILKKLNYVRLRKIDASVIGKNVRTRIYINNNNVIYNTMYKNLIKPYVTNSSNENNLVGIDNILNNKNKNNKYIIKNLSNKTSESSGLGLHTSIKAFTLYKGSIFTKLEFTKNINNIEEEYKIIIINSHLFYKKSGNTGLEEREKELLALIREFKLIEYWKKGYNIFFCGDMNFRLNVVPDENKKKESYKSIINKYLSNNSEYKRNSLNEFESKDELYQFILKQIFNDQNIENKQNFFIALKNSIDNLGIHLSSKYHTGRHSADALFYKNKRIENYNKIFNIYPNQFARVPSATDRIIYALSNNSNLKIHPYNFNVHLEPDKSDHKMITLSFELSSNRPNLKHDIIPASMIENNN
jgi:hypothetical protein